MTTHAYGLDVLAGRFGVTQVSGGVRSWDNHFAYAEGDVVFYEGRYYRARRDIEPPMFPVLMSGEVPGASDVWKEIPQPESDVMGARRPMGVGLKDGRGYGPYGRGYVHAGDGIYLPYGPMGEALPPECDFRRGSDGKWQVPRKLAPGVTWYDSDGNWGRDQLLGYVSPDTHWYSVASPSAIRDEMDKVLREGSTLDKDIHGYSSDDASYLAFLAGWDNFWGGFKAFYAKNATGVGG